MVWAETTCCGNSHVAESKQSSPTRCDECHDTIGCTASEDAVVYIDLTAARQSCSRVEGLRTSATRLACVGRAGALGRSCSPCDESRKPLHASAD